MSGIFASDEKPAPAVSIIPVPDGFAHEEELQKIARLVIALLESDIPAREIKKRLARHHPAQEGV